MKLLDEIDLIRLKSLINLLDDEDESIYFQVRENLISMGVAVLPILGNYFATGEPIMQERIKETYEVISLVSFKDQMRYFRKKFSNDIDLEEGILLLSKLEYPQIDTRIYGDLLNFYASEFQARIDASDAPDDIAFKIGKYFAFEKGFSGHEADYYNVESHYLNKVLETKMGVPIALSAIYLLSLRKLNFPVSGIGMPGHFIIRYDFKDRHIFVDPFHDGKITSEEECKKYLITTGYEYKIEYLEPVNNKQILERMLRNLVIVYEKQNQTNKVQALLQCIDILNMIV